MRAPSTISRSVKYGLHFAGIWPGTPCPGLHKFFWVTFMAIFQTYQYRYVIMHFESDSLLEMIDNLSIAMPFSLVCIKLIVAWTNHSVLRDILSTMEEDCQKYAILDTNNFIPKTAHLSYRLTSLIMSTYVMSAAFYAVGAFASQGGNDSTSRELLLKMDLPFETSESPIYELVVTTQFLHQTTSAFTFGVFSALLLMVSKMIGDAAYETLWYDLHPNENRLLVLLILRSQKGFPLTFGRFSRLSLESFTAIMKASASYVSVLLAMS